MSTDLAEDSWGTQAEGGLLAPAARRGRLPGSDGPGTRHGSLPEPIAAVCLADADWLRPSGSGTPPSDCEPETTPGGPHAVGTALQDGLSRSSVPAPAASGAGLGSGPEAPSTLWAAGPAAAALPSLPCDATLPWEPAETRVEHFQFAPVVLTRARWPLPAATADSRVLLASD